ncbi:MAG: nucleotidyl transferase AbiEii/AbiGii toxin family protein, partial [Proteobacteria bacterium]|nr:nucleotidyl transferase AbiEii/AbiGii toxin family protein [Pseudomonadota bacterium]
SEVQPLLRSALEQSRLDAVLEIAGAERDKLLLRYSAIRQGTGYVQPAITLEFGGRATGEPRAQMAIACDMQGRVDGVSFPVASPWVMSIARTFWEKATATHVYCAQGRIRGERYARHWHDLAAIMRSPHFDAIVGNRQVARAVAEHKLHFFSEKNADGDVIDYAAAVRGTLQIVPEGPARQALLADYALMLEDEIMVGGAMSFDELMQVCAELCARANSAATN